jgi:large subunit ribosomal protein L11
MVNFTKEFNAASAHLIPDTPCQVHLEAFNDRTFKFKVLTPPTSWFIKKCLALPPAGPKRPDGKGASKPGTEVLGYISLQEVYEIAVAKQKDRPTIPLQAICRQVVGSCNSMGVEVINMEYEGAEEAAAAPA